MINTCAQRICILLLIWTLVAPVAGYQSAPSETKIQPFKLDALDGTSIEIAKSDEFQLTVFCFVGTECPLAKLYSVRLQRLFEEFQPKGVRLIGIGSNLQDSTDELHKFARKHNIRFPIAKDYDNEIADDFGAKRTPEVFIVDNRLSIRYRGRIDDQYSPGIARSQPTHDYLRDAITELLAGKTVSTPVTSVEGCLIGRVKRLSGDNDVSAAITYANQIARVFQKHCIECHRPGEIGPFSLNGYDDAVGWAEMIVEVVDEGRMPPWHASNEHVALSNARVMPDRDKQLLRDWVASGTRHGDPRQLPEPREFVTGWRLPQAPDMVIQMSARPFKVPAQGTVEYQYFVVDPGFEEDRWISAAEVVPGNPSVVHHSIVFVRPPDGQRFRGSGWIGAYVPGQNTFYFGEGYARMVPAGSKLVFQQHYTPNGTPQTDVTKVGLIFADEGDVSHEIVTLIGIDQEFEIPPHTANHQVQLQVPRLPDEGQLLSVAPHMHWRGKSFDLFARSGPQRQQLLEVPQYDFNWQHNYRFAEPISLNSIDALEFTVAFDNSSDNTANPDPTAYVTWGDQTWEEMAIAFFEIAQPRNPSDTGSSNSGAQLQPATSSAQAQQTEKQIQARAQQLTDDFFERLDLNRDGVISRSETPHSFRRFGFGWFDDNGDDQLSRDEIRQFSLRKAESEQ